MNTPLKTFALVLILAFHMAHAIPEADLSLDCSGECTADFLIDGDFDWVNI